MKQFKKAATVVGAMTLALTGLSVVGATSANAAGWSGTQDWIGMTLENYPATNNRTFQVCNWQSAATSLYIEVDAGFYQVEMQDVNTGWTTYGTTINFNSGACEAFRLIGYNGSYLEGYFRTNGHVYKTGVVYPN